MTHGDLGLLGDDGSGGATQRNSRVSRIGDIDGESFGSRRWRYRDRTGDDEDGDSGVNRALGERDRAAMSRIAGGDAQVVDAGFRGAVRREDVVGHRAIARTALRQSNLEGEGSQAALTLQLGQGIDLYLWQGS